MDTEPIGTTPAPTATSPASASPTSAPTAKGLETRRRIVEAALELVTERGYEKASMRAIAKRAGVSAGNAYYYFPSKAHLVQAFYNRVRRELLGAVEPVLARERTLEGRVRGVMWAWFRVIDPYHDAAAALLAGAADPGSPLNPFSPEAEPDRDESIALYRLVVEGSSSHVPPDLRPDLPALLWAAQLGITLFWIHDDSPRRERTQLLIDRGPGLLVRLVGMSRLPGMGDLRRQTTDLIRALGGETPGRQTTV